MIQNTIAIRWRQNVNVQQEKMKVYRLVTHPKERGQNKWGGWILILRNSHSEHDVRLFLVFCSILKACLIAVLSFFSMTRTHFLIAPLSSQWECVHKNMNEALFQTQLALKYAFILAFFRSVWATDPHCACTGVHNSNVRLFYIRGWSCLFGWLTQTHIKRWLWKLVRGDLVKVCRKRRVVSKRSRAFLTPLIGIPRCEWRAAL